MGCWNGTCAISNLPILAGEKVIAFFVQSDSHPRFVTGNCYVNGNLNMIDLPFEAAYNDYGSVEDIVDEPVSQRVWRMAQTSFVVDHDSRQCPEKIENLEDMCKAVERGCVTTKGTQPRQIGLLMVLQSVWNDVVVASREVVPEWGNPKEETRGNIFARKLTEYEDFCDRLQLARHTDIWTKQIEMSERRAYEDLVDDLTGKGSLGPWKLIEVHPWMMPKVVEAHLVMAFMDDTRRNWVAPQGRGSQDVGYENYLKLTEIIASNAQAGHKRYYEDEEDED